MKSLLVLVTLASLVGLALSKHCHHASECGCGNGFLASCFEGLCNCTWMGVGKREQVHCQSDEDCAGYDCSHHAGNTPYCQHHGDPAHGHNLCNCR